MLLLLALAPLFLVFELWQLVICERYLGIKQISRGTDPRELGLSEKTAFIWTTTLFIYWGWIILMLFQPVGRGQLALMLIISIIGYSLRKSGGLKWALVILTFEGALRIGMLATLTLMTWRKLFAVS